MNNLVSVSPCKTYDEQLIYNSISPSIWDNIGNVNSVVLKPNWVRQSHQYKENEWEYVITHPTVIGAVIKKLLELLKPGSEIYLIDAPETESSMEKILEHYPIEKWKDLCSKNSIKLEIIDLRDDEWISDGNVIIERKQLPGDPKGKTVVNLHDSNSEFYSKKNSNKGFYGADYNIDETNKAHDGKSNLYSVSTTAIKTDLFINLPKLKTHKKAGITCCLKNLVGINTYKNYLPHHSLGTPNENGDQFPVESLKRKVEGNLLKVVKNKILISTKLAKYFSPLMSIGRMLFGSTNKVVRSGNWYGNDTIWRMILDLNKVLFYANSDGSFKEDVWISAKKYIGVVDAIYAGEGNGPKAPDLVEMGYIIAGTNPVSIDAVCAKLMGFEPLKIPAIENSFKIENYKICDFLFDSIVAVIDNEQFKLEEIAQEYIVPFKPHFGWKNHIEDGN